MLITIKHMHDYILFLTKYLGINKWYIILKYITLNEMKEGLSTNISKIQETMMEKISKGNYSQSPRISKDLYVL